MNVKVLKPKLNFRVWAYFFGHSVKRCRALLFLSFFLMFQNVSAQQLTLHYNKQSLADIVRDLSNKSEYSFIFDYQSLRTFQVADLRIDQQTVPEIMTVLFKGKPFKFTINGKVVSIVNTEARKVNPTMDPVTQSLVKGMVTDSVGNRIGGVTVTVKGATAKTMTDGSGEFSIQANTGQYLLFKLIGFKNKEVLVQSPTIKTVLDYDMTMLQEVSVINTGYQAISKERATGSFTSLQSKALENKLAVDLRAAMEGQVPGMNITKGGNLEFRGVSTFNAEKNPLIIVDGYPITGDLSSINKDNVESITILKDAVAASIYGARSSNGVIVITTKKGQEGRFQVQYTGTFSQVRKPDLSYLNRTNTLDYIEAETELYNQNPNGYYNSYVSGRYISHLKYLLIAKDKSLLPLNEVEAALQALKQSDGIGQLQKHLFQHEFLQQHNLLVTNGTDKNNSSISLKYIDGNGNVVLRKNNQLLLDINHTYSPTSWMKFNLLSNLNYVKSSSPLISIEEALQYDPNRNVHPYDLIVDPNTGLSRDMYYANPRLIERYAALSGLKPMNYNLLDNMREEMNHRDGYTMRVGGNMQVKLLEGLRFTGGGVWSNGNSIAKSLYTKESYAMRSAFNANTSISNSAKHYIPDGDRLDESRARTTSYTLRAQLDYHYQTQKHYVTALLGHEISKNSYDLNVSPTRFGYNDLAGTFSPFNYESYNSGLYNSDMLGTPLNNVSIGSFTFRDNRFVSYYSNASYEYDNRFLLSGSARMDLTNFFGTDAKYRYKPLWSIGGTYKLSNESFFNRNVVNRLFIRGSYGINGNISLNAGPFLVIAPGSYSVLTNSIPYNISSPPNNSLRWEKTKTTNVGLDLGLLQQKIQLSLDYYSRISTDLLAPEATDPTLGYTTLTRNVGQINNSGLEANLNANIIANKSFKWNVLGTFTYNQNKVKAYDVKYLYATSFLTSVNREGYASNAIFSYRNAPLDANGNPQFYDKDHNLINGGNANVDDLVYSGTLRPKYIYGLTNSFSYKNIDLSFLLVARTGNAMRKWVYNGSNIQHEDVSKRWRKPGDEANTVYPVLSEFSFDSFYFPYGDAFVESANFLKLRDISLRYNFASGGTQKLRLKGLDFTVQMRNVFMWTANSQGIDPEGSELTDPDSQQAEIGFTPFRPRPEFYFGIRIKI